MVNFQLCLSLSEDEFLEGLKNDKFKDYIAEEKYDGCRCIARADRGNVILMGRHGILDYPEIKTHLSNKFKYQQVVLDGEIVCGNSFNDLQNCKNNGLKPEFIVFDVLFINYADVRHLSLRERLGILNALRIDKDLKITEYVEDLITLYKKAKSEGKEGIVLKPLNSGYSGERRDWIKIKYFKNAELKVIKYEVNNKGIRAEDEQGNAVQIASDVEKVRKEIDEKGSCNILIQYLEQTKDKRYRFISFRGIK